MSATVETTYCGHCGDKASSRCKACGNMYYCSVECQQADWSFHKLLCKHFIDFKVKPNENYRRAILLPLMQTKPRFIWLPVKVMSGEGAGDNFDGTGKRRREDIEIVEDLGVPTDDIDLGAAWPKTKDVLGTDDRSLKPLVIGKQNSGELLDHSIWLLQRRDFIDQPRNLCLKKLVENWLSSRCCGPIVFCGMTKVQDSTCVVDIDTRDFTLALDGLVAEYKKFTFLYMYQPTDKMTKGVRASASEPHLLDVKVPLKHPVFTKGQPSKLAQFMGIGLRTLRYPSNSVQVAASALQHPRNLAAYLHVDIDVASPTFGMIPDPIKGDSADVLVVTDSSLGGRLTLPNATEALQHFLVTTIKDMVFPHLNDSSKTVQQRLDTVRLVVRNCLGAPELQKQYGSLQAAHAV